MNQKYFFEVVRQEVKKEEEEINTYNKCKRKVIRRIASSFDVKC